MTRPVVDVDVQVACDAPGIPDDETIRDWVIAAARAAGAADVAEISVRVVDAEEIRTLNRLYRDKDRPTNVLSFPAGEIAGLPADAICMLGDVVVCAEVVGREAREQRKRAADHWAHMLVHGTLHLLGLDHEAESDAAEMEALERRILAARDISDPYSGT